MAIMTINIKNGSKKDIQPILELLYELERPSPINENEIKIFKNKIKGYLSEPNKTILVANKDSKIVGFVSIMFLERLNRSKLEMYIPDLVVTKKFRNMGIGKNLIDECIKLAKEKNCFRIRLESGNQRKKSHNFYLGLGFEQSALSFSKNFI